MYFFTFQFQTIDHPHDDLAPVKNAALYRTDSADIISHRPNGAFKSSWGSDLLNKEKEYLKINARTNEGQMKIAIAHNVKTEWEAHIREFDSNTPIATKCFKLRKLVSERGFGFKFRIGLEEGGHRGGAAIQALTGSRIDDTTGIISGPGNLTYKDMTDGGHMNFDEVPNTGTFQDQVQLALSGRCQWFDEISYVRVKYVSTDIPDITIETVLSDLKTVSEQLSDNKIKSVRKAAWIKIGELGRNALLHVDVNNIDHIPDTSTARFDATKLTSAAAARKLIAATIKNQDALKEQDDLSIEHGAFGVNHWLCGQDYTDYCANPFDSDLESKFINQFTFPSIDDKEIKLSPPFLNTHQGLTQIIPSQITTWTINSAFFYPKIIHLLFADKMNIPLNDTVKSKQCCEMAAYAARYHSNNFGLTNCVPHGVMSELYSNLTTSPMLNSLQLNIIGAAIFIGDTFNTALCHPNQFWPEKFRSEEEAKEEALNDMKCMASTLDTMYSTMKGNNIVLGIGDVIHNLGTLFLFSLIICSNLYGLLTSCSDSVQKYISYFLTTTYVLSSKHLFISLNLNLLNW